MAKFFSMLLVLMAGAFTSSAQSSFSFNCSRDTTITDCSVSCITLKAKIPDVRSSTSTYVINPMTGPGGCFQNYVDPGAPGTSTNLTIDDRYTSVINLPFTFPFWGTNYNSLIASTNGYLSFDVSKANAFAHWAISADLPSTTYDRAMIMGPYHDLDPSETTSPTQRIKYDVWGTAPHRRWILSFYKVPLFGSSCSNLIENTHQIVLYEGLGIVEVIINSKQPCTGWNSGRAIVGMQDFNRTQAIMAPNRTSATSPWGSVNMNESWRFVPATGPSLFRKVELFDLAGNLIATGDTTGVGNNVLEVSFPNVCPTATTQYVVRSEYESFNDPNTRIIGTDTIRVIRSSEFAVPATVNNVTCNGATTGSFTITAAGTGPFEYSINAGATYQSSGTFSGLAAGTYTVRVRDNSGGCVKDTTIIVTQPDAIVPANTVTSATCANPGTITVNPTGGVGPFTYSLDGTTYQSSNVLNTGGGNYTLYVQDANGCVATTTGTVNFINDLALGIREDTTLCAGVSVRLNTTGNAASYSWSPATGLDNPSAASPLATPMETTTYTVTATTGVCSLTETVTVNVDQQVSVSAGPDFTIITGEQVQLNGSATNATSIEWTPATGLNNPTILNPIAKPDQTTVYTLTASNAAGCIGVDQVVVTVIPYCIKVKNAFTPNGDGINDLWQVYDSYDCLRNITLTVFNRYGNKVFESKDYRNDWNGTYKGKPVPDGTYYAVLNLQLATGKTVTVKTDLTIIR